MAGLHSTAMTTVQASTLLRLFGVLLLGAGLVGCNDMQRPAPVYYGQPGATQPGYAQPAYPPQASYAPPSYPAPRPSPSYSAPSYTQPVYTAPVAPLPAPASAPTHPAPSETAPPPQRVVIEHGETLYAIARRYEVPVRAIIDANHLEPPYRLVAGQSLILPQPDSTQPASPSIASAPPLVQPPPERPVSPTVSQAPGAHGESAQPSTPPAPQQPASLPPAASALPPVPAAPAPSTSAAPTQPPPSESASLPPPPPRGGRSFLWPVHGSVIARFGPGSNGGQNDGIDIAAPEGTPVLAAESGIVAYAGNELRGYGNLVLLKHADGWLTAYGHNARILVKRGDRVQRGQVIAHVGATGAVTEPQLHFEIRKGTHALDPLDYLEPLAARG
jgi:murein DD-endopeptidase MepM/ murein hydrolase activator NlpD